MATVPSAFCRTCVLTNSAPDSQHPLAIHLAAARAAKVPETALEVLIQKSVEDGVEAAVGVAQRHTEEVGTHHCSGLWNSRCQSLDQNEDVDGCPADYKHSHHDQH